MMSKKLKEMKGYQKRVFMMLPKGLNNPISTREIEDVLGLDKRTAMGVIETLILDFDIPIGSFRHDEHGYFIATTEEEKRLGTYSLIRQIETMKTRVKKVQAADLTLADQYKEKYKDEAIARDEQLNVFDISRPMTISPKLMRLLLKANSSNFTVSEPKAMADGVSAE